MKFLFKRGLRTKAVLSPFLSSMNNWVEVRQLRLAEHMNAALKRMTSTQRWCLFIVFCLVLGGASAFCIVSGFHKSGHNDRPQQVAVPAFITPSSHSKPERTSDFTPAELQRLFTIERYVDSLKARQSPVYDSIVKRNPRFENDFLALKEILRAYKIK